MTAVPTLPDRAHIYRLLGDDFGGVRLGDSKCLARTELESGWVDDLSFTANSGELIPAYFLRPKAVQGPTPAILYCHAHGANYDIGRRELVDGRQALQTAYANDLAALGFAALCIEMPCFGARKYPKESALAKSRLWHGRTLFGQMLGELRAGLDFLAGHPEIDPGRIGAMGISMGGTHAWWLSALDPRIRASANMCCFADLQCLIGTGGHDGHGQYMTVPGLLQHCSTGKLAGLSAPRPQFFGIGLKDAFTPEQCFETARKEVATAYANAGGAGRLTFHVEPEFGHEESPAMRRQLLEFLDRNL